MKKPHHEGPRCYHADDPFWECPQCAAETPVPPEDDPTRYDPALAESDE